MLLWIPKDVSGCIRKKFLFKIGMDMLQEQNCTLYTYKYLLKYSSVPNKQAGSNKQAGRNFYEISIIKQVLINKQGGKIVEFQ